MIRPAAAILLVLSFGAAGAMAAKKPAPPAAGSGAATSFTGEDGGNARAVSENGAWQLIYKTTSGEVLVRLKGQATQGGLLIGTAKPGYKLSLDGKPLMVSPAGQFLIGFDRDAPAKAELTVEGEGHRRAIAIDIQPRKWDIQRIDGLPPDKVTPPPEALEQIKREAAQKRAARKPDTEGAWFAEKFIWPAEGRISGVFGSQRILNGEPRAPHYGLDIAAPEGTPIKAPAGGIVRLAVTGFFYEGGLVFLDHGHGLISYMMHMSRVDVKPGEEVKQGDTIGAVGKTGRVTAAHLHWGIFWLEAHIDPQLLLPPMPASSAPKG